MKYNYLGTEKEKLDYFQSDWIGGIYGELNELIGIVLHDAAAGINSKAEDVAKMTTERMKSNSSASNYHNIIDDNGECFAICGEKYATYSLGDKNTTDTFYPNDNFISIEIAPSLTGGDFANEKDKEKYYKAWKNACKLVADYCVKYKLSENDIYQHRQYGSTSCPYTMAKYFGSYEKALLSTKAQVKQEIENLKNNKGDYFMDLEKKYTYDFVDLYELPNKFGGGFIAHFKRDISIWDDVNEDGKFRLRDDLKGFKKGDWQVCDRINHNVKMDSGTFVMCSFLSNSKPKKYFFRAEKR